MVTGHHRPLVCAPCGSGKTVIFAWLARQTQLKHKTVWFLVHRRELLDQTYEAFRLFDISTENIHIGMVATVANHLDRFPQPDLIILDEGHHASAATWRKIISAFPAAWLIGLTATPCRLDGKPLGMIYDDLIIGATTDDLITTGYLAKYKYYAPTVADLSALQRKGFDYDQDQASEILMKRAVYGDVIQNWHKYADGMQTIIYCSSIKHSKATASEFRMAGINAVHFDGDTNSAERKEIVQRFRDNEIQILCNVDLIGEGFDVPGCWCCVLLRPTMSTGLFIQQSGRALRPMPDKTAIILDCVGNYVRNGLPADYRDWSLKTSIKPQEEYSDGGMLTVRQCPYCYYTFKTGPVVCPNCGELIKSTRKEIENIQAIELQEITEHQQKMNRIEVGRAKSYAELKAIEKARGYRPGWAYFKAKARKYKV